MQAILRLPSLFYKPRSQESVAPLRAGAKKQALSWSTGSLSSTLVAVAFGLALLGVEAPRAGTPEATEVLPFNDTQGDLTLAEIVGRFEQQLGLERKHEAYRLGKLLLDLAERYQLSPSLIVAVIESESSFRPDVISKAGAVGLMQIQPETAGAVAKLYHVRSYHSDADLTDPAVNMRLGVAYLSYLRHQFGQSFHYLAAYNLGPTAFRRRLRAGRYELGSLSPYVMGIHERAQLLRGSRLSRHFPGAYHRTSLHYL